MVQFTTNLNKVRSIFVSTWYFGFSTGALLMLSSWMKMVAVDSGVFLDIIVE